ncbi:MAG: hypothetical protein EZS28_030916 [Streblomastix strix]|uniref:Calpain catalytic domain-containing protein n=1 Tax=Streblomastix strix TaxID=222440 RepID=A0A5J4UT12_9EUKA|nr:MAG: hypothetical protein EZS28_030916 [Streblomastix strix]
MWIPDSSWEIILIQRQYNEWKKLIRRMKEGKVIISIGTKAEKLGVEEEEQTGLDSFMDYALLNVFEFGKIKLLQIRNPHGTKVWRGNFCPWDKISWTDELQEQTGFTLVQSEEDYEEKKDGVFFMELGDFNKYFTRGCICWNPDLFPYKQEYHFSWDRVHYMHTIDEIGLFDEDIHVIDSNEVGITEQQKEIAIIQENTKDYVGWFTIRIGLHSTNLRMKDSMRFSLFAYSDQQIEKPIRVDIYHKDENELDAYWTQLPMMEFNSNLTKFDINIIYEGKKLTKKLQICNSVKITQDKQRLLDGEVWREHFGGDKEANAFFCVARLILGTRFDLILIPRDGVNYGEKLEINVLWEKGFRGGIHFEEIDSTLNQQGSNSKNKSPFVMYDDKWLTEGIAWNQHILNKEKVGLQEKAVIKKRFIRLVPFTSLRYYNQIKENKFKFQQIGPEGYDVSFQQVICSQQIMSHELAWTDSISSSGDLMQNESNSKHYYILKPNNITDLHLQFIALQFTKKKQCPQFQFQLVKLGGLQFASKDSIALRIHQITINECWGNEDKELIPEINNNFKEQSYSKRLVDNNGTVGWVLSPARCFRLDEADTFYSLCITTRRFVSEKLTIAAFAWSNSFLQLFRID